MRKPELLAPAGSWDALVAAVQNGADAVYLGGKSFNARHSADNFDDDELARAIEYAHVRGVKVHVTMNILLADTELKDALRFLRIVYNAGADALIVQDLGFIWLARLFFPDLDLHASTQMTVHNVPGAIFLRDAGIKRIVLARELGLDEVCEIRKRAGVEVETFVHGALCVCYSGQCLMSSMIGGRSGNRGRCAQPCRLEYRLVDDKGKQVADNTKVGDYLLSPRDLNISLHIPELIKAGIDAFKIEGRMRRPEYVATVTKIYRTLIDRAAQGGDYFVTDAEAGQLAQVFNREFTTGYFYGVPGHDLMSFKRPNNRGVRLGRVRSYDRDTNQAEIELEAPLRVGDGIEVWVTRGGRVGTEVSQILVNGQDTSSADAGALVVLNLVGHIYPGDRVFKTHDAQLMENAVQTYSSSRETRSVPLDFKVWARVGEPMVLEAADQEWVYARAATRELGQNALNRPLTKEFLAEQLNRLGNTPFVLNKLECDLGENVMIPVSEINDVRRQVVEQITELRALLRKPEKACDSDLEIRMSVVLDDMEIDRTGQFPALAVAVGSASETLAGVKNGAELVYFSGDQFKSRSKVNVAEINQARQYCSDAGVKFYVTTPRIAHDREIKQYLPFLHLLLKTNPDGILASSVGWLTTLRELTDLPLITDFSLNVFNHVSALSLKQRGVSRVTLSTELTGEQVKYLASRSLVETEVIVHGVLPLMVSRYCVIGSVLGGKGENSSCSGQCHNVSYALLDRKGVVFPVETDQRCLMHIYNSRELCLLDTLPSLVQAGLAVLRIEARRENEAYVARVVKTYRKVLDSLHNSPVNLPDLQTTMEELVAGGPGFTRGHYYRGVMD